MKDALRTIVMVGLLFAALVIVFAGCDAAPQADQYTQAPPQQSPEWISPILGSDPDVYRLPNMRRPDQPVCPGPNCPNR